MTLLAKNTVPVIDENNNVIGTIQVGNNPRGTEFNSANSNIYVSNEDSSGLSVIDVNNNIIENIHINGPNDHPISLEFNPANNKLYADG